MGTTLSAGNWDLFTAILKVFLYLFAAGNTATTAGGQQQGLENSQPLPNPWAPGGNTPAPGVTGTPSSTEGMPAAGAGTHRSRALLELK